MVIKLLIYNPCILTFTQLNRIEYHFKESTIFTLVDKKRNRINTSEYNLLVFMKNKSDLYISLGIIY